MTISQILPQSLNGRCVSGTSRRLSTLQQPTESFRQGSLACCFAAQRFVASRCLAFRGDGARGNPGTSVAPRPLQSPDAVAEYARQHPLLRSLLGIATLGHTNYGVSDEPGSSGGGEVSVTEVSGGRINFVWRVSGPKGDVVLKYAAPFVRSIGAEFQLSQARLGVEAEAMAAAHTACPQHVPQLLLHDAAANVIVQELVSGPQGRRRVKLVDALAPPREPPAGGNTGSDFGAPRAEAAPPPPPPPGLAADLASLLTCYLLRNSVYELPHEQHAAAVERLRNGEVVAANAAVVFTDPWDAGCARNRVPPGLEDEVACLRADPALRQEVSRLLGLYRSSVETLIHNDLTAGNILVPEPSPHFLAPDSRADGRMGASSETHLIDWEFATYGPMAYDIGSLLGNLLLSYCATACRSAARQPVAAEAEAPAPLLRCIAELWEDVEARIRSYTSVGRAGDAAGSGGAAAAGSTALGEAFTRRVLSDSLGYAGCVMARLVFGMHHYPALEAIPCGRQRSACQRLALRLAAVLLRPEELAARGWDCIVDGAGDGGGGGGGSAGSGRSSRSGIWQLVHDAEVWAAQTQVEAEAEACDG